MSEFSVFSPAKVNLDLKILHKREDSYHEIESIMAKLAWGDELVFEEKKEGIEIRAEGDFSVPTNGENLVYKAADLLRSRAKGKRGLRITIKKNIPTGGGLGGGSSNAAETLKFLNDFWGIHLPKEELMNLGKRLGADVPFFIDECSFAEVKGIGEKVTPLCYDECISASSYMSEILKQVQNYKIEVVLVIPKYISINTVWAYQKMFDFYQGNYPQNVVNTFEEPIFSVYPDLQKIKEMLLEAGAIHAAMTGSGSVMFGIFKKGDFDRRLEKKLEEKGKVIITTFI